MDFTRFLTGTGNPHDEWLQMKTEGFSKGVRLRYRSEFQHVREEGRSVVGPYFRLNAVRVEASKGLRLGIITTRKFGGAVERNRFRRQIREVVRRHFNQIHHGTWLVVIARRAATGKEMRDLCEEWLRLGRKLSILRNPS